jgi:hypothetical protein
VDNVARRDRHRRIAWIVGDKQAAVGVNVPGDTRHEAADRQLDAHLLAEGDAKRAVGVEQAGAHRVRVGAEGDVPPFKLAQHLEQQRLARHRGPLRQQGRPGKAGWGDRERLRGGRHVDAGANYYRRAIRRLLGQDARELAVPDQDVVRPLEHRADADA